MFVLSLFYHVDLSSVIWKIRDSDFNKKTQLFCNHFQTKEKIRLIKRIFTSYHEKFGGMVF